MHRHRFAGPGALFTVAVAFASGCAPSPSEVQTGEAPEPGGGAFGALHARGEQAIGVNQSTSTHLFDALANGGRIELQRDVDDPAGVDEIRRHLGKIAEAFASGDFSTPAFVHLREAPGTAVMAAKDDRIESVYRDLPGGAELRLVTNDLDALRAIHEFMAFQREDHRAGGMEGGATDHGTMHRKMDHATIDHGAMDHGTVNHGTHGMMPGGGAGRAGHGGRTRGGDTP